MSMNLEFSPPDKRVLNNWGTDRVKEMAKIGRLWVDKVGNFLKSKADQAFPEQKQPGGAPWPSNSESWKAYKASQGKSTLTNIYTGAMRDTIELQKDKDSVKLSSPLDYAEATLEDRSFMPTTELVGGYVRTACEQLMRANIK